MSNIILEKTRKEFNSAISIYCRECGIELNDDNWFLSYQRRGNRICKKCCRKRGGNYVKKYRLNKRKKLLNELGNKCEKCGYDWRDEGHCARAMEIHHLDKTTKKGKHDTSNTGNLTPERIKRFIRLYKESKIKLLCCRCHREEEAGV